MKGVSKRIQDYFGELDEKIGGAYKIAEAARKKGFDPGKTVEMPLVKDMAERVEGLIGVVAPKIVGSGVSERIMELEGKYGALDWRIALVIAEEIANEKFCKFEEKKEAMEIGIRAGFAYITMGVVASPLEGFVGLRIKKRKDGKEYLAINYAGPVRSAGGTGESVSVLIVDYIRKKMGYEVYDPTEEEVKRFVTELYDYHEHITNLQYLPSEEEIVFLGKNLPVQLDGEPSEKIEVSNYKDLERVETNIIRNGVCLVMGEGIAQKAPKLWKQISKWGKEFGLGHWEFLGDFVDLQKKLKAKGKEGEEGPKVAPDFTFIKDLVAGRPVFTHPMQHGGFRLRYGRARTSGYSSDALSPVTMGVLNKYVAIGTQFKVERPGKATSVTSCDYLEGPVVKTKSGDVVKLKEFEDAKNIKVDEILFLGDMLVNYGDFLNRAHTLVPPGYVEEWWVQELEKATVDTFGNLDTEKLSGDLEVPEKKIKEILKEPIKTSVSAEFAINTSKKLGIPLHPEYTYHWKCITPEQILGLVKWFSNANVMSGEAIKIVLPLDDEAKRSLELAGVPHLLVSKENIVLEKDVAIAIKAQFSEVLEQKKPFEQIAEKLKDKKDQIEMISLLSSVKIRDKSGIFIGARMGRPEKAKMRKLTGSPQVLFPVGEEGGRFRCFQSAMEEGKITADFPLYNCDKCKKETIYSVCEGCGKQTSQRYYCTTCGTIENEECSHGKASAYKNYEIDSKHYFEAALKDLRMKTYPDLIKGVKGTSNREHIPEHIMKGILRAKHDIYVNKDGTTRYDMTQLAITHFKPKEIGTSVEVIRKLGYTKDIHGKELSDEDQVLELIPQDIILPSCDQSPDEGADHVLFRVANFIDELLEKMYGLKPFYNLENKEDIVGHVVLCLAPHTSAAIAARIIGFSKTQGFFAHPMLHAATRRDCLSYDTSISVYNKKTRLWSNTKIGEFVESLNPNKKADSFGTLTKDVDDLYTFALNPSTKRMEISPIKEVSKHSKSDILELLLESGESIKLTTDHKVYVKGSVKKSAGELCVGDKLVSPTLFDVQERDVTELDLYDIFEQKGDLMARVVTRNVERYVKSKGGRKLARESLNLKKSELDNYLLRDSYPSELIDKLGFKASRIGYKRDSITMPTTLKFDKEICYLVGMYIAEGYARKKTRGKGFYQIAIACTEEEIRERVKKTMKKYFGLSPSEEHSDHLTFSSRMLHELFIDYFKLGRNAHEKNIPPLFLNLPLKKLSSLLQGYFDGDGSVSLGELRVTCDTVSQKLIRDLIFALKRYKIFLKQIHYEKEPGNIVKQFYIKKNRKIPKFRITKLVISSRFAKQFYHWIGFRLKRKRDVLKKNVEKTRHKFNKIEFDEWFAYPRIINIIKHKPQETYCINLNHHNFVANNLLVKNCDGDEACVTLLMDALLNFSRKYLPAHRGSVQDAPLVLTSTLIPSEVDDMVFDLDTAWKYPLEFYNACLEYKKPWDIDIDTVSKWLGTDKQYEGYGYTHETTNINKGIKCSAYKVLPSMEDKLKGQMELAEKIRAVDEGDVAGLVIEKHFLKDTKGNLRKFSMQQFRCVQCNKKYRRPPLVGKCSCGGKIIFTISEGSVVKYLQPSISLAEKYDLSTYLKQSLDLLQRRIEGVFGKEKEKQLGLGKWFG